jgi:hypothetical protein
MLNTHKNYLYSWLVLAKHWTGHHSPEKVTLDSDHHCELVLRSTKHAEKARDPNGMQGPFQKTFLTGRGRATSFYKVRVSTSSSPYPLVSLPTFPGLVKAFSSHYYGCCIILANLGMRMPWLASKKENYFLSPLHPPVAFSWMHSVLSSLLRC